MKSSICTGFIECWQACEYRNHAGQHKGRSDSGRDAAILEELAYHMRVKGMHYWVPAMKATELGWCMAPPAAGSGKAKRVLVEPAFGSTRKYLEVPVLGSDFVGVPLEGYSKNETSQILAKASDKANKYAEKLASNMWYNSAEHVGTIALCTIIWVFTDSVSKKFYA